MQEQPTHWKRPGATRIAYAVYTDPGLSRLEQERLFRGATWNDLCLDAELGSARVLRIVEGPSEVHRRVIARDLLRNGLPDQ